MIEQLVILVNTYVGNKSWPSSLSVSGCVLYRDAFGSVYLFQFLIIHVCSDVDDGWYAKCRIPSRMNGFRMLYYSALRSVFDSALLYNVHFTNESFHISASYIQDLHNKSKIKKHKIDAPEFIEN